MEFESHDEIYPMIGKFEKSSHDPPVTSTEKVREENTVAGRKIWLCGIS